MQEQTITAAEFRERLAAICRGPNAVFPRRSRDRHIIYRSIIQVMNDKEYSEQALNSALLRWISDVAPGMDIDHVTLRRYLVDEGYLDRSPGGATYRIRANGRGAAEFDTGIERIDPIAVINEAREQAEVRKKKREGGGAF